jgi:predicted O-methyltransferase YrrM
MPALIVDTAVISHQNPSKDVLIVLDRLLADETEVSFAEVGLGLGATTRAVAERMNGKGEIHLFDYDKRVVEIERALQSEGLSAGLKIVGHGNTRLTFDSYSWRLALLALEEMEKGGRGIYDLVYLDGAHNFHHDAPACLAIKELIRPGGYLVLDDVEWCFASSPSLNPTRNPKILEQYTQEQIATPHIKIVDRLIMKTDPRFQEVRLSEKDDPWRTVYRKA